MKSQFTIFPDGKSGKKKALGDPGLSSQLIISLVRGN